jgi:hypothetical protein
MASVARAPEGFDTPILRQDDRVVDDAASGYIDQPKARKRLQSLPLRLGRESRGDGPADHEKRDRKSLDAHGSRSI